MPALTMEHGSMVKTQRFAASTYLGDPINAVRILNVKEVDELIVLDITATREGRSPDLEALSHLASECFMPVCYGGGIRSVEDAEAVLRCGYEKVAVNSAALARPSLVEDLADRFGSQAVVVSIDVDRGRWGMKVRGTRGRRDREGPAVWARRFVEAGAGELLVTATSRDGTAEGYDLDLIAEVASVVEVPVLALGGAGSLDHISQALEAGAAGAVAGRLFLTRGPHLAALVSYPTPEEIEALPAAPRLDG